jgi:hypothetical protein
VSFGNQYRSRHGRPQGPFGWHDVAMIGILALIPIGLTGILMLITYLATGHL